MLETTTAITIIILLKKTIKSETRVEHNHKT